MSHQRIVIHFMSTLALVMAILCSLCFTTPVSAATIVVTTTADSGAGSLRQAIIDANANSGADEIMLPDGTYTLSSSLPQITSEIVINGGSASTTIIQSNASSGVATYRVFSVTSAGNLTLSDITIKNGRCYIGNCETVDSVDYSGFHGGGIYNNGILSVINCKIVNNVAVDYVDNYRAYGGGIFSRGTLKVEGTTVTGNSANYGGGITNEEGTTTIEKCIISTNTADTGGGGIFGYGSSSITTVSQSTIENNNTNLSVNGGGGILSESGIFTLKESKISENSSAYRGGGVYIAGSYSYANTMNISNSIIIDNDAMNNGGGVYNGETLNLENVTIARNSAEYGGGVYMYDDYVSSPSTINNSTFYGNIANYTEGTGGGGLYVTNNNTLNYTNTIITHSTGHDCVLGTTGTLGTNNISNLVQDGSCGGTLTADIKLAALADNGGDTMTYALLEGSPAIDTGDDSTCESEDQRGVSRPIGEKCDIGAFETGYPTTTPAVDVSSTSIKNGDKISNNINNIKIVFNKDLLADGSESAVDFSDNYLLVEYGVDALFNTTSCSDGVKTDDVSIPIGAVGYDSETLTATITVNNGTALPVGSYRLFVCGTTSITDQLGKKLNNGTSDTTISFSIYDKEDEKSSVSDADTLPVTGFPVGKYTHLPEQPDLNLYAASSMSLTIPTLGVEAPIVGVPEIDGTWDVSWLGNDVGYLYGSAYPTWVGNTVLTGHVWDADNKPGIFAKLKSLVYGDHFVIYANGKIYTYEVRENELVKAYNVSTVFRTEEYDWVTLVTCEQYNPDNETYLYRRIVRAVLIAVE